MPLTTSTKIDLIPRIYNDLLSTAFGDISDFLEKITQLLPKDTDSNVTLHVYDVVTTLLSELTSSVATASTAACQDYGIIQKLAETEAAANEDTESVIVHSREVLLKQLKEKHTRLRHDLEAYYQSQP
ncbi:hypothetical protein P9112_003874 [Eukaryota sp. TZLM1-RC]